MPNKLLLLPNETVVDVWRWLSRLALCRLELVSAHCAALVRAHFARTPPYIRIHLLFINRGNGDPNTKQHCLTIEMWFGIANKFTSLHRLELGSWAEAAPWLAHPFVRAETTYVDCLSDAQLPHVVPALRHVWSDASLKLLIAPSTSNVLFTLRTLITLCGPCARLHVKLGKSLITLTGLPQMRQINQLSMRFETAWIQWAHLCDWLDASGSAQQQREAKPAHLKLLVIYCSGLKRTKKLRALIERMKQRFLAANRIALPVPALVEFSYLRKNWDQLFAPICIYNTNTDETLRIHFRDEQPFPISLHMARYATRLDTDFNWNKFLSDS